LRQGEVDFTTKNKNGEIEYYQVAWEISGKDAEEREYGSLKPEFDVRKT
jgi:predicted AAA+ superfamily ATPase